MGLDVVRAARICTVGRGGQILLSETTRALVGSGLPEGVTVFPLGQRHLRVMDEPERVYEVAIDGVELEETEPAVQSSSPAPTTARPSEELDRDISQRFEGLGARLAAGIEERVLHALEGKVDRAGTGPGKTGSVDEIASRMASLGDEIDARVRAALAGKAKGKGSSDS